MVKLNPQFVSVKRKRLLSRLPEYAKKNAEEGKKKRKTQKVQGTSNQT